MKKIYLIIGLSLFFLVGCTKEELLEIRNKENIEKVIVSKDSKEELKDKKEIDRLIKELESYKKTKKESVNDTPSSDFTKITVKGKDSEEIIFLYEEYEKKYLEKPYEGIYELKE